MDIQINSDITITAKFTDIDFSTVKSCKFLFTLDTNDRNNLHIPTQYTLGSEPVLYNAKPFDIANIKKDFIVVDGSIATDATSCVLSDINPVGQYWLVVNLFYEDGSNKTISCGNVFNVTTNPHALSGDVNLTVYDQDVFVDYTNE